MKINVGGRVLELNPKEPFINLRAKNYRSDKKIRVNISLNQKTHELLNKLAKACDIGKTTLAGQIVTIMVSNPDFVNYIQDKYEVRRDDRVIPIIGRDRIDFRR